jgi:Nitroreductase
MKRILVIIAAVAASVFCLQAQEKRDFMEIAADRYAVRKFSDKTVDQSLIDKVVEAGRLAPTAKNKQPQKIYVARSEKAMKQLKQLSPCIYGAPQCFIICYDSNEAIKRDEGTYGEIDATIVMTHMVLECENLGIGTCIVGYFDKEKLHKKLNLPENIHPVLLVPFGYPAEGSKPSPRHYDRRLISETVEYL